MALASTTNLAVRRALINGAQHQVQHQDDEQAPQGQEHEAPRQQATLKAVVHTIWNRILA